MLYSCVGSKTLASLTETVTPKNIDTPPTRIETPPLASPTVEGWKIPTIKERKSLLAIPEFFTKLQGKNTNRIITKQFDDTEYARLSERKVFRNNTCTQSTLTTIAKMCEYFNTGKVPSITIADVYVALDGKNFTDVTGHEAEYIVWNDAMYFVGIPDALKLFVPQFISKTEFLIPNYGTRHTRIVPQTHWQDALSKAQAVCEDGGFVIIHCLKYGTGHTLLATDVKMDGIATIVDSYSETVQREVLLKNYFEWWVDPEAEYLGKQPGLLNVIGVTLKPNVT